MDMSKKRIECSSAGKSHRQFLQMGRNEFDRANRNKTIAEEKRTESRAMIKEAGFEEEEPIL